MALKKSDVKVGDTTTQVVADNLTRTQIVQYAGASGDYNPLHSDEVFTTKVAGYPSVFAHGMLSMGATGKLLTDYVGDGMLTYYGVRFTYQVWPGDTLTATATVTGIREEDGVDLVDLDVSTTNQDGVEVIKGQATGPPRVLTAVQLSGRTAPGRPRIPDEFGSGPDRAATKPDLFDRVSVT